MKKHPSSTRTLALAVLFAGLTATGYSQTLAHRWSFSDTAGGATFADSVGGANGTVINGPSAALDGSRLQMDGVNGYGLLPSGMISNYQQVTIEFWASYSGANPVWTRTFSFGNQNLGVPVTTVDYCHFAGGDWQNLNATTPAGANWANNPGGLNGQANMHVTCVVDPVGNGLFYYNGTLLRSQPGIGGTGVIPALTNIVDEYGLIGRSLYDVDPTLNGSVDEFRIYNGVLSQAQVAINDAAGPDSYVTTPGALNAVDLTTPTALVSIGGSIQLIFKGDFANVTNVNLLAYGGSTFGSANPGVLTVNSNGVITAVAVGTTSVTGTNGGLTDSVTLTVAEIPASLNHRYSFTSDASDSVGAAHGTLNGTASISGGQVVLDGVAKGNYVSFPGGQINIATNTAITVEIWATHGAGHPWARLWEFGNGFDNANNMGATPMGGNWYGPGYCSWSVFQGLGAGSQTIALGTKPLENQTMHSTIVIDPVHSTLASYTDGVLQFVRYDANPNLASCATNLVSLGYSSAPPDPAWEGSVDEFRIYSGVMTAPEIALSHANGPGSTNRNPGALQSIQVVAKTYPAYSGRLAATVLANYANLPNFDLLPTITATLFGLSLTSSDPSVVEVLGNQNLRTHQPGTATLTAVYQGHTNSAVVTVENVGALAHRYSFTSDATDSIGTAHGTLNGGATVSGGALVLDDSSATYLDLPPGMISNYNAVTIDAWVTFNSPLPWTRVWFFGDDRANQLYLSPTFAGGANHMFENTGMMDIFGHNAPPSATSGTLHITCVAGNGCHDMYINGAALHTYSDKTTGLEGVGTTFSRLGFSPYGDPGCNIAVDEFRIYNGRLAPDEILATDVMGPAQTLSTSATLEAVRNGSDLELRWPLANAGFVVQATANLGGSWATLTNTPVLVGNTNWVVTVPAASGQQYFRLWR
jgi:hypothetical protein